MSGRECPKGVEMTKAHIGGYEALAEFEEWKCAIITYAERFSKDKLWRLERHMETDEVFILVKGEASLYIGETGEELEMEKYASYSIKKGVWHAVSVSEDAFIIIVENRNTGIQNTEYMNWKPSH